MKRKLLLILSVVLGVAQLPWATTVCLCTGETGTTGSLHMENCAPHVVAKCGGCEPVSQTDCFAKKLSQSPDAVQAAPMEIPLFAAILLPATISAATPPMAPWTGVSFSRPHIREPDRSHHLLRAPPTSI